MDAMSEICRCYEAQLAALAELDRVYYLDPSPALAARAEYYHRDALLQKIRILFYAKLKALQHGSYVETPNC